MRQEIYLFSDCSLVIYELYLKHNAQFSFYNESLPKKIRIYQKIILLITIIINYTDDDDNDEYDDNDDDDDDGC